MKLEIYWLVPVAVLSGIAGIIIGSTAPSDVINDPDGLPEPAIEKAFDGDTVLIHGQVVKIRGLDAPEVATNASCLSEAALGGLARQFVAGELYNSVDLNWQLENVEKSEGRVVGDLIRSDGEDIVDLVTINGYGIASSTRWDWCRREANFDDNDLYPAINVSSGPPSDVQIAND